MSDSSTAAMNPKEQVKICGNCGNSCGHKTKLYGCVYSYVPCLLNGTFEHECNYCSDWIPRTDTLEQRYQQLEQVAQEMWMSLTSTDDLFIQDRASRHREQLQALGVDVRG